MNRTKKLTKKTPVPVVGKTSSHPLKFKLSNQPTRVGFRKEVKPTRFEIQKAVKLSNSSISKERDIYKELGNCCDMRKPNRRVVNLFKRMPYRDLVKHIREEQVQALKMLYFKGWLMSRD